MSKILLAISNGLLKDGDYYPSGFMEQIITELKNCGNNVLVYVPNRFQKEMFSGNNELLDNIDTDKLDDDIKQFNPDLVITFNNTIYNKVVELTDCPIVVWGADTEPFWNSKDIIKNNLDRYFFFCFSEQEIGPRKKYFNIPDSRIFLMKPATNIKNTHSEKDKNISFIGTFFNTNPYLLNLIEKHRGKNDLRKLWHNFSSYFIENNDVTKDITDVELLNDFINIPETEYISLFSGEKRTQTLINIADLGLHLWGNKDWERVKTVLPSLYACLHRDSVTTVQENEYVYNTSKINININHDQSINGMNFRICDVLASGGCLISSYSPFVREQFKEIPIPMFNDSFEARELCKKYLNDEKLREDFVLQSNAVINKKWRWNRRFEEMEQILGMSFFSEKEGSISIMRPSYVDNSSKTILNKKLKIICVVHTLYTNTYDTLYYESLKRKDIDFQFVLIPFKQSNFQINIKKIKEMMDKKGYPFIIGYNETKNEYLDLKKLEPDVIFLQTPYDSQRISPLYSSKYLSSFCDVYHISYGGTMLDYDVGRYKGMLTGLCSNFKGIFSESTSLANYLNKYNPGKYIPIGYMKCDKYLHYNYMPKHSEYDFIIAWKPRWTGDVDGSNLLKYFDFFINLCQKNTNFQLVFIKHQLTEQSLIEKHIKTASEVKKMFDNLKQKNIKIVEDGDFLDDVFNADVFVGDYSSTIMEFALTKKPVIYTPVSDIMFSDYGNKVLSCWYIANSIDTLRMHLINLKNRIDPKKKIRVKKLFLLSDTPKTKSIAQDILNYLMKNTNRNTSSKITNLKNKIRYKIWKHLDKKLRKKGITS